MFPIFIPINTTSSPSLCPHCHKPEKKIEVCSYCEYHYPQSETTFPYWWLSMLLTIGLIYFAFGWFFPWALGGNYFHPEWWQLPTFIVGALGGVFLLFLIWFGLAKDN